jgi:hypothetical protein
MKYTLNQTYNLIEEGFQYNIPEDVLESINKLSTQVGAPNYVKTPVFVKRTNDRDKEKKNKILKRKKANEDWTKIATTTKTVFKTTKIEKSVGLKKNTDDIRLQLNKLSDKNYDSIYEDIILILDNLDTTDENYDSNIIGNYIFDLASSNRFYSKTYAKLFRDLSIKYDYMNNTLRKNCDIYIKLFDSIEHADPNENYERFCEINKSNEMRRALSAFLVNLMQIEVISRNEINTFLVTLMCKFDDLLHTENMQNEANEICENFCLLFDSNFDYCNNTVTNSMSVNDYLKILAIKTTSNYKSLTNKTKFKIMDLCDL